MKSKKRKFGHVLKDLMTEREISQVKLAKAIGVSNKTLSAWVGPNGRVPRDMNHLRKLADFFQVSLEHLLFDEPASIKKAVMSELFQSEQPHEGIYKISIQKIG